MAAVKVPAIPTPAVGEMNLAPEAAKSSYDIFAAPAKMATARADETVSIHVAADIIRTGSSQNDTYFRLDTHRQTLDTELQ